MTTADVGHPVSGAAHDNCMVLDAGEIRALLRRLLDARSVLVGQSGDFATPQVTALLHVGESGLLIDAPRPEHAVREWLASPLLRFESSVERISVSFACGPARLDRHAGQLALAVPIPSRLRYQQRREYLRIAPPAGGLRCRVPRPGVAGEPAWIDATILDIGGGGAAMLVRDDGLPFTVGDVLAGCMIDLPQGPPVTVNLLVRHIVARAGPGPSAWQAGCEFVDLPTPVQDRLFRYVMHLERERMARRRGT